MKSMASIATLALVLSLTLALPMGADARFRGTAAGPGPHASLNQGAGLGFVDDNGDGVCDWAQSAEAWNQATGGQYGEYVDADGDGVCDNYANRPLDGTGLGYRGGR